MASPSITLFHNPRCSKSRAVHGMLTARGLEFRELDYLHEPLDLDTLRGVMRKLGLQDPRAMMRTAEATYAEAGCDGMSGDELLHAMLEHRILIQRPILIVGDAAAIGRPPENAERLLDG